MVFVAGTGFINGDPMLLLTTWDYDGNGCGYSPKTKDYPYLYFPSIDYNAVSKLDASVTSLNQVLKYSTCVKKCPSGVEGQPVECYPTTFMTQNPDYYQNCIFHLWAINQGGTPFLYETSVMGGKFCVPSSEALKDTAMQQFQTQF